MPALPGLELRTEGRELGRLAMKPDRQVAAFYVGRMRRWPARFRLHVQLSGALLAHCVPALRF